MSVTLRMPKEITIGVGAGVGQRQGLRVADRPGDLGLPAAARGRPTISALKSTTTILASAPPRRRLALRASFASRRAMSPVPPAQSTMVSPGCGLSRAAAMSFQIRCTPADIRSFIRS